MSNGWELVRADVLLDSPHVRVTRETVRTPSRPQGREWTKVSRKVGVTVAPRLADGSFVLIREERVPARRDFWQFPAGQVDGEATEQTIAGAARRELSEEAGCTVTGTLEYLGKFFTSPGFTDEHTHQFLATEVHWDRGAAVHDGEEQILEMKAFGPEDLREMVTHGVIEDANTLGLYARLAAGEVAVSLEKFIKFRDERDTPKPFLDHVEDLRRMVVRMAIALGICMVVAFIFRGQLASFVQAPLLAVDPSRVDNLQSLGVADSMTISFKLAFYAGLVISFPVLLYFLAEFVLPALTVRERRIVLLASIVGFGLFLAGVTFAFSAVLPAALEFFFQDAQMMQWRPTWTVGEYYSFTTQFVLAFGLAFELPVVVLALVKVGLLEHAKMKATRPYAIVVIFLLAAVITPTPDIFTLVLMGAPMVLLYEACIWIARWMEKREALTTRDADRSDQRPDRD